jgi:hypothetical protein
LSSELDLTRTTASWRASCVLAREFTVAYHGTIFKFITEKLAARDVKINKMASNN